MSGLLKRVILAVRKKFLVSDSKFYKPSDLEIPECMKDHGYRTGEPEWNKARAKYLDSLQESRCWWGESKEYFNKPTASNSVIIKREKVNE